MPRILRVNNPDGEPIGTAHSVEGVWDTLEPLPPGRYHVDEISSDPLPNGHTSRRWGVGIKRGDWMISIDRDPWPLGTDDKSLPRLARSALLAARLSAWYANRGGVACRDSQSPLRWPWSRSSP